MRYVLINFAVIENGKRKFRTLCIDTENNDYAVADEGGVIWENPVKIEDDDAIMGALIDPMGFVKKLDPESMDTGFWARTINIKEGKEDSFRPYRKYQIQQQKE